MLNGRMEFEPRKAFISLKTANIYKFEISKPSKLAVAQTVERSIRYFKFINKAVSKLIQCFLRFKFHTAFNIKNVVISY